MNVPSLSTEALLRWLYAVGGLVTGVASTVIGSWVSSKIHVYHDSRNAHLEDIKQKILIPLSNVLSNEYGPLVTHKIHVIDEGWGVRNRREEAGVTEQQIDDGPLLLTAVPEMRAGLDLALYTDARKRHFSQLLHESEQFADAWRAHANDCHGWVDHISQEILTRSGMQPYPVQQFGTPYVAHYKLALFVYRRLFGCWPQSLFKRVRNSPAWAIEGFAGTSAEGTEQQLTDLISILDNLVVEEKATAERLKSDALRLKRSLMRLCEEISYALASRRLRKRCDLVPFV